MKKTNNIFLILVVLFSFAGKANAGANTPLPLPAPGFSYWAQCWVSVTATSFGPLAQLDIDSISLTFDTALSIPLQLAIDMGTMDLIKAHGNSSNSIIKTLATNYSNGAEADHKMAMDMMDGELAFMQSLAESEMKHDSKGFFTDGNGEGGEIVTESDSYSYAKTLCTRNKIMKQVSGPASREKDSNALSESSKKDESENSKILSVAGFKNALQKNHYDKYCSQTEYEAELCEEVAIYPLGDINASNFLFPEGSAKTDFGDNGMFSTQFTYNPDEINTAEDFVKNIVWATPTRKPTLAEMKNTSKSEFVMSYNQKYAALNMANYSFKLAIEKRKAKTTNEQGTPLSTYDLFRYQMENTMSSDAKLTIQNSKKKGVDFMLYSAMLVENKLELERMQQQERIENLLAAINAAKVNKESNLNNLESMR